MAPFRENGNGPSYVDTIRPDASASGNVTSLRFQWIFTKTFLISLRQEAQAAHTECSEGEVGGVVLRQRVYWPACLQRHPQEGAWRRLSRNDGKQWAAAGSGFMSLHRTHFLRKHSLCPPLAVKHPCGFCGREQSSPFHSLVPVSRRRGWPPEWVQEEQSEGGSGWGGMGTFAMG